MKKKNKLLAFILLMYFICTLFSCRRPDSFLGINVSPTNKTINQLTSKIYEDSQLDEIVENYSGLIELNNAFEVESLRTFSSGVRVSFRGDKKIAVLLFDIAGNKILGRVYNQSLMKSDYDSIIIGMELEEVRSFDPDGLYYFLWTGIDAPKISEHYTLDGFIIYIWYDDSNRVSFIHIERA